MRARGAGFAVAAAFIGPGTVATAILAGSSHGAVLVTVVVAAALVTFLLQFAAARPLFHDGLPFGSAVAAAWGRVPAVALWLAVLVGALAFEAGNLTGALLGLEAAGAPATRWIIVAVADLALLVLWFGRVRLVLDTLTVAVAAMAVAFVASAIGVVASAGWPPMGTFAGAGGVALALVGTTVVPYNLFLHGGLLSAGRAGAADEGPATRELALSVFVGAVVTASIVVSAAGVLAGEPVEDGPTMARTLEGVAGGASRVLFGVGLAAAGFTSAVTAPLAAALAGTQVLDRSEDLRSGFVRTVALGTLAVGTTVALLGTSPVPLIVTAQALNGLLVPLLAVAAVLLALRAGRGTFLPGRP